MEWSWIQAHVVEKVKFSKKIKELEVKSYKMVEE